MGAGRGSTYGVMRAAVSQLFVQDRCIKKHVVHSVTIKLKGDGDIVSRCR